LARCAVGQRPRNAKAAPSGALAVGRKQAALHPTQPVALLQSLFVNQNLKGPLDKREVASCGQRSKRQFHRKRSALQSAG
jgi:hypothetical protein